MKNVGNPITLPSSYQATAPPHNKEQTIWNCTIDKQKKVAYGKGFTIFSHVDPADRCYFVFTHKNDQYKCCYESNHDSNCNSSKHSSGQGKGHGCINKDNFLVKVDSRGRSHRNTCNFTTWNVDFTSHGNYHVFNKGGQTIPLYMGSKAVHQCDIVVEGGPPADKLFKELEVTLSGLKSISFDIFNENENGKIEHLCWNSITTNMFNHHYSQRPKMFFLGPRGPLRVPMSRPPVHPSTRKVFILVIFNRHKGTATKAPPQKIRSK